MGIGGDPTKAALARARWTFIGFVALVVLAVAWSAR